MTKRTFILLVLLCCWHLDLLARSGGCIGYGRGTKEVEVYRVGATRSWANDGVTPNKRRLTGYWELGLTKIHNPIVYSFPTNDNLEASSFSAVLRVPVRLFLTWYFDIGIGIAYVTNKEISTRDLGSKWLFEDRLGAGFAFGPRMQYDIGYRFIHYSNAYLAQVNQGINLHLVMFGYWF